MSVYHKIRQKTFSARLLSPLLTHHLAVIDVGSCYVRKYFSFISRNLLRSVGVMASLARNLSQLPTTSVLCEVRAAARVQLISAVGVILSPPYMKQ